MRRVAGIVMLVNTVLPLLIGALLVWGGMRGYAAYEALLAPQIREARERVAELQVAVSAAETKLKRHTTTVMKEAQTVAALVSDATKPLRETAESLQAIPLATTGVPVPEFQVSEPVIKIDQPRASVDPGRIDWKDPFSSRSRLPKVSISQPSISVTPPKVDVVFVSRKFDVPEPMSAPFQSIGTGLGSIGAIGAPMDRLSAAATSIAVVVDELSPKISALRGELAKTKAAWRELEHALEPLAKWVLWGAIVLLPWLAISYFFWAWRRVLIARALMSGRATPGNGQMRL